MHRENNSFVLGGVCYRACIVRYGSAVEWSIVVHPPASAMQLLGVGKPLNHAWAGCSLLNRMHTGVFQKERNPYVI